jgi:hypothetical protein
MKRNEQEAECEESGGKHGKPDGAEEEKPGSRKAERRHPKSSCEAKRGREGKEETEGQVAGTGREADERKRIGRGKTESESIR